MSKTKLMKPAAFPIPAKPKITFFQKSETWLAGKQKMILVLIVSFSVLFRIVYFVQLNSGPCIWQHRYEESDMYFYDQWAKIIERGDWLSNCSFHQYQAGHKWIAEYYFKTHPGEVAELHKQLGKDKSPDALGKLLWSRWDGGKIYHQDPLYIYFVAIVYKIFGEDVRYVFFLQMIIGILSILLIYIITRKYFGNVAAAVSGLMAACCGPLMFYELTLVRESIIVFAGLLLVYLLDRTFHKVSVKNLFILGIVIALCMLLKSTFSLFFFLSILLLFVHFRKDLMQFAGYAAVLLAGALIAYVPLITRNSIVGVPFLSQNCVGAISVIASNDVNYNPEESYALNLKNTIEILVKTNGKTLPSLIESIKTHPDAFSFFNLLFKKFKLVFHWYEFPNNKNFYYYRLHAPVLQFTFINILFIVPLAITGIIIAIIQRKKIWSLYLLMLLHLFLLVFFIVLSRYRIPLEAAMIPFAGFAIAEIIKTIQSNTKYALMMISGIILTAFFVGRPLPSNITLIRGMDFQQPYNFYYKQIIDDDLKRRDAKAGLATMTEFMSFEPDDVKRLNRNSVVLNNYQQILTMVYAAFHGIYANLYSSTGDSEKAKEEGDRAAELQELMTLNDNSGSLESLVNKARLLTNDQKAGSYRNVADAATGEIKLNPNNTDAYHYLNEAYDNLQKPDSCIIVLQQLLKTNAADYYACFQLGTIYGRFKNDFNNAILYLEKAKAVNPKSTEVYLNLGIVYGITKQNDKALEMMKIAATLDPGNKNNLHNLEMLLRETGKIIEADEVKNKMNSIQ